MMLLRLLFASLCAYAVVTGLWGGAVIAFIWYLLVLYAERRFAAQEKVWLAHPRSATSLPHTASKLDEHCTECSDDRI